MPGDLGVWCTRRRRQRPTDLGFWCTCRRRQRPIGATFCCHRLQLPVLCNFRAPSPSWLAWCLRQRPHGALAACLRRLRVSEQRREHGASSGGRRGGRLGKQVEPEIATQRSFSRKQSVEQPNAPTRTWATTFSSFSATTTRFGSAVLLCTGPPDSSPVDQSPTADRSLALTATPVTPMAPLQQPSPSRGLRFP